MNAKQKALMLWAAAPAGAYLLARKGVLFAFVGAAGLSYLTFRMITSARERETLERLARVAGEVSDFSDAIRG